MTIRKRLTLWYAALLTIIGEVTALRGLVSPMLREGPATIGVVRDAKEA